MLLGRLERECPGFLSRVDMIAGTSTGSIIALLLAAGYDPEEVTRSYEVACPEIFKPQKHALWPLPSLNIWRAKYSNVPLRGYLEEHLGEMKLSDVVEKDLVVTAFRLDGKESSTHRGLIPKPIKSYKVQVVVAGGVFDFATATSKPT